MLANDTGLLRVAFGVVVTHVLKRHVSTSHSLVVRTGFVQAGAGGGKYVMRDLMRVLEQEKHAYTDPVTEVVP